jgi:hypothetical protein
MTQRNRTNRENAELAIISAVVEALHAAGYDLALDNGGDELAVNRTRDKAAILAAMRATDSETLFALKGDANPVARNGRVFFVYGNDGYDVIADNSASLESILETLEPIICEHEAICTAAG